MKNIKRVLLVLIIILTGCGTSTSSSLIVPNTTSSISTSSVSSNVVSSPSSSAITCDNTYFKNGCGSEVSPYLIYDIEDFYNLDKLSENEYARLENDIIFNENYHTIERFNGILDGNNMTLRNINVTGHFQGHIGLFAYNYGTIKNLNVSSLTIMNEDYYSKYAGFIGTNEGLIENCNVSIVSKLASSTLVEAGAVAGVNNGVVRECTAEADIFVATYYDIKLGGLVGYNCNIIENCEVSGNVHAEYDYYDASAGGVVGTNDIGAIVIDNTSTVFASSSQLTKGLMNVGTVIGKNYGYYSGNKAAGFAAAGSILNYGQVGLDIPMKR